jgi:hypothetical protein
MMGNILHKTFVKKKCLPNNFLVQKKDKVVLDSEDYGLISATIIEWS